MSKNFDLVVARTMAEQMGGERTRTLLRALCDEVEHLRAEVDAERAAVVAYLRSRPGCGPVADAIEECEHRKTDG